MHALSHAHVLCVRARMHLAQLRTWRRAPDAAHSRLCLRKHARACPFPTHTHAKAKTERTTPLRDVSPLLMCARSHSLHRVITACLTQATRSAPRGLVNTTFRAFLHTRKQLFLAALPHKPAVSFASGQEPATSPAPPLGYVFPRISPSATEILLHLLSPQSPPNLLRTFVYIPTTICTLIAHRAWRQRCGSCD
eukprot:6194704-Pleurochrysis_carterae.AAC.1